MIGGQRTWRAIAGAAPPLRRAARPHRHPVCHRSGHERDHRDGVEGRPRRLRPSWGSSPAPSISFFSFFANRMFAKLAAECAVRRPDRSVRQRADALDGVLLQEPSRRAVEQRHQRRRGRVALLHDGGQPDPAVDAPGPADPDRDVRRQLAAGARRDPDDPPADRCGLGRGPGRGAGLQPAARVARRRQRLPGGDAEWAQGDHQQEPPAVGPRAATRSRSTRSTTSANGRSWRR